jgi:nucleoside 2-deoxyribosyltransferase
MQERRRKVYCAGPLFTEKEREEMEELASALEQAGFSTFLPQRDGLELTKCVDYLVSSGMSQQDAGQMMSCAIFALDMFQVLHGCHALVANLNGRVPDEGTVSEAAMAWSRGKPVVGYKADSRTAFGGRDNPLVAGLFEFKLCPTIEEVVQAVYGVLAKLAVSDDSERRREEEIRGYTDLGRRIASTLERRGTVREVADVIRRFSPLPASP